MKKKGANIYEVLNVPYFVKNLFCIIFCCHVLLLGYVMRHLRGREVSHFLSYSMYTVVPHLHYCSPSITLVQFSASSSFMLHVLDKDDTYRFLLSEIHYAVIT